MTNLTACELLNLQKFMELAREAADAEKIISKVFSSSFGIGKDVISVYDYSSNNEYYGNATLSINNMWHYHDNWWGGRDWQIECSVEGIFNLFKNAYLIQTKQPVEQNNQLDDTAAWHFRNFIKEITDKN